MILENLLFSKYSFCDGLSLYDFLHGKNGFADIFKNLAEYRSKIVETIKIII